MPCVRCGRTELIEKHHIRRRIDGGGDEPENKEELCQACHDFEHAKRQILESIQHWTDTLNRSRLVTRQEAIKARLRMLSHRLEVLESLNTVVAIRATGKYKSYWIDETTHNVMPIPRYSEPETVISQLEFTINGDN